MEWKEDDEEDGINELSEEGECVCVHDGEDECETLDIRQIEVVPESSRTGGEFIHVLLNDGTISLSQFHFLAFVVGCVSGEADFGLSGGA